MKTISKYCTVQVNMVKQKGVVLFFALIAMVVMMLAAVALIRSVDTSSMIAGNLAFKMATTSSGNIGIEAAMTKLLTIENANKLVNVLQDPTHPFNITNVAVNPGYFSSANTMNLTLDATWDDVNDVYIGLDSSGNAVRYIIERMCRTPNALPTITNCLFSAPKQNNNEQSVHLPQDICAGAGCPKDGQSPQIRITVRTTGPKNTSSYLQAFVY